MERRDATLLKGGVFIELGRIDEKFAASIREEEIVLNARGAKQKRERYRRGLNSGPVVYKTTALPLSYDTVI